MNTRKLIIALTTVGDAAAAAELARVLVGEGLAACVNRVHVDSTYRWEGKVVDEGEVLCLIKSTSDVLERLRARLEALHGYDVPEFVVIEPSDVAPAYLAWALDSVRSA